MIRLADHIIIAPVVLPLFAGAVMLALGGERHRNVNAAINVVTSFALVAISIALLRSADAATGGLAGVYRLGDWPAPFAIVFVADRLAALMLLLTSLLALAAVVFSLARWHRVGVTFPPSVSVPAHGHQRCIPHGRPVQPLRFLRGAARGFVRLGAARFGIREGSRRIALHRRQPRSLAVVSDRRQSDLRRGRYSQYGRSRRAYPSNSCSRIARYWKREPASWPLRS